ncbi:hypothetical protein [Aneurinibacillus thermoaerophilus]|uniref:hypothetical protein n=1 Tax=Aneurinibacillus thermoaerophilus TaxID=143495 RepID=UPI002E227566|nr:hypothetical protein [Aneurinibacillus thermoaerophilus]
MAPENQQDKNSAKARQVVLPVSLSLLVAAGGVATYQWSQHDAPVSGKRAEHANTKSKEKKPGEAIRLNTDDNQVKNTAINQFKENRGKRIEVPVKHSAEESGKKIRSSLEKEEALLAFSLKNDVDWEVYDDAVYLVDSSNKGAPIAGLAVDQSDIILPEPPLLIEDIPLLPVDDLLSGEEETTDGDLNNEQNRSENVGDQKTDNNSKDDAIDSGPVLVPGSLYNSIYDYVIMNDSYNVVYYGQNVRTDDKRYNTIMKWLVESADRLKGEAYASPSLSYQGQANLQLIHSLKINQPEIQSLQEEIQKNMFMKYVDEEINAYAADKERHSKDAKHIVYFIGKYNEQANKSLNPSEYGNADRNLMKSADQDARNSSSVVEALNKYQIASQYAPDVAEESRTQKKDLLLQVKEVSQTDISKAVILAAEAVENGNHAPEAREELHRLAEKLLEAAEEFEPDAEEQAYEILSTRASIDKTIAHTATNRKKAFAYAKKAEGLLSAEKYAEALYYASESKRLYDKSDLNDRVIKRAVEQMLKEAKEKDLDTQLAIYRSITSANGVPHEYAQQATFLQKAIDDYRKAMNQSNLEQAVQDLSSAWQHSNLQKLVEPLLKEKSRTLFEQANAIRNENPKQAARYFRTLAQTPGVDVEIKERAKSMLDESNQKNMKIGG